MARRLLRAGAAGLAVDAVLGFAGSANSVPSLVAVWGYLFAVAALVGAVAAERFRRTLPDGVR